MKSFIIEIARLLMYCLSCIVRSFSTVNKHKVLCVANRGKIYGCNPKYITEYLLNHFDEYQIYWLFGRHVDTSNLDKRIHVVRPFTFKYIWTINTAGIIINNFRSRFYNMSWKKRQNQIYIMTWHGPLPLKKIEKDLKIESLQSYQKIIDEDNKYCDLMLSCSQFTTRLIRGAMGYNGEILEDGVPRNDIFFDQSKFEGFKDNISKKYNFSQKEKVVLYAPTFRTDHSTDSYDIVWDFISPSLKKHFNDDSFIILYRIHPDLKVNFSIKGDSSLRIINVSDYPDMQELLCISDLLITDYSSTMFEYAILKRPCFIYASDYDRYDRDFYFDIKQLPFPFSKNSAELSKNIQCFNEDNYLKSIDSFMNKELGYEEDGNASESLCKWIYNKTNV